MERKKVVFLLSRFPYPLIKGDKLRAYHQIVELSAHCDIYLFALTDERVREGDKKMLEAYCREIRIFRLPFLSIVYNVLIHFLFTSKPLQVGYFYNGRILKKILQAVADINADHLFCQLIRTAEYGKQIRGIPRTLDYMDALSAGMERRMENASSLFRWVFRMEARRLKKYEHHIYKHFDSATVISTVDRDLIFHFENEDITVLPNGIDTEYFAPRNEEVKFDLLFTGNMSYPPNVQSAQFLVRDIMPIVWKEFPQCRLLISGANPKRKVRELASERVHIRPWIEDIRDSYAESRIFIAPMLIGSGMQNKLLEAMSMSMPCVTSQLANQALGAKENEDILIGRNAAEYAAHLSLLLKNPDKARDIAEKGHNFVTHHFSWSASNDIILNIVNNANGRI